MPGIERELTEFEKYYEWLMTWEKKTVTTTNGDRGGQTAWGISRVYFPLWPGWALVDKGVVGGAEFEDLVLRFYRGAFWRWAELALPGADNRLLPAVTDMAIHSGYSRAVGTLQYTLCRIAGSEYLMPDGIPGPKTNEALRRADQQAVLFAYCGFRMVLLNQIAERDKTQRPFLRGWIARVSDLMEKL